MEGVGAYALMQVDANAAVPGQFHVTIRVDVNDSDPKRPPIVLRLLAEGPFLEIS